jgi:hypothetical protein
MHSIPIRSGTITDFSIMQNGGDAKNLRPPPSDRLNEDLPAISRFDVENLAREVRPTKSFFDEVTKQDLKRSGLN